MNRKSTLFLFTLMAMASCVGGDPTAPTAGDATAPDATTSDCLAELAAGHDVIPGRFIVSFRADRVGVVAADREAAVGTLLGPRARVFDIGVANAVALDLSPSEVERLRSDPRVAYVEPDGLACAFDDAEGTAGKPQPAPACANGSSETVPSGLVEIGAPDRVHSGAGVTIAVVDSGIDLTHPDLVGNIVGGTGFVGNVTGADDEGHGTHVAGTIAALEDNGLGVVGVAPDADLLAVKVLDRRGRGSYSNIAAGIDWAVANGANVINLSLGGTSDSQTLRTALQAAHDAGVFVAVAAGNEGSSATQFYPAAYDDTVITVSAEDAASDGFPSWSNYGVPPVDLAAPGVNVCSSTRGGGYGLKSGTSMATPHVAGAAALALEGAPGSAPFAIRDALLGVLTPLGDTALHTEDLLNVAGL